MIIDHIAVWLTATETTFETLLRGFGRFAAPIMCYLIAEGYFHTSDVKKYMQRLFILALISHFPYVLYFGLEWWQGTSIIWGLFLGLIAITTSQSKKLPLILKIAIIIVCCLAAWTADWNYIGVLWVLAFGMFRERLSFQLLSFFLISMVFYIIPGFFDSHVLNPDIRLGLLFVIPLLALYNGKRGKKSFWMKWGFYIIYPLHFLILYIMRYHIF